MLNRICQILSIISFIMVASMTATGVIGYRYVTSEQFKAKVMNEIMENVSSLLPKAIDKGLPKVTGQSMPIIK